MTDCTYRPWTSALALLDGKTYADVLTVTGIPSIYSLHNDFEFYNPAAPTPNPPISSDYKYAWGTDTVQGDSTPRRVLTQWVERVHSTQSDEAYILIHGTSILADAFFSDAPLSAVYGSSYANFSGSALFADGFDIYAPFVVFDTDFQSARRRASATFAEQFSDLDRRRIVNLFNMVKAKGYSKIHLVGISYGGQLVVSTARSLAGDPQLGFSLAIEGWWKMSSFLAGDGSQSPLWAVGWEESFSAGSMDRNDFYNLPPNLYLARGSCDAATYTDYDDLTPRQIINYDGAHEVQVGVVREARCRYLNDHGVYVPQDGNGSLAKCFLQINAAFSDTNAGSIPRIWTTSGAAAMDTATSPFSLGSAKIGASGVTDFISTPDHPDFTLGAADFSIAALLQFASVENDATCGYNICSQRGATSNIAWTFDHYNGQWEFYYSSDGTTLQTIRWPAAILAGTPYDIVITRTGTIIDLWVDGVSLGEQSITSSIFDSSAPLHIGGDGANAGGLNGWIKKFSLSVG